MASASLFGHSAEGRESTPSSGTQPSDGTFLFRRVRHSASGARFGSNCSISTLTGGQPTDSTLTRQSQQLSRNSWNGFPGTRSTSNLLDQTRLLSMQEDAHCRRITVEVMKRCLYKSVVPCRRRAMNRLSMSAAATVSGTNAPSRLTVSVPVTPIRSKMTSPVLSPSGSCSFFGPMTELSDAADADYRDRGLASLFRPRPRYVRASCSQLDNLDADDDDVGLTLDRTRDSGFAAVSRFS